MFKLLEQLSLIQLSGREVLFLGFFGEFNPPGCFSYVNALGVNLEPSNSLIE